MRAGAFDGSRQLEQFDLRHAAERFERDNFGLALGQRAGLVDQQRIDLFSAFERLGVLDQNVGRGTRARRRP